MTYFLGVPAKALVNIIVYNSFMYVSGGPEKVGILQCIVKIRTETLIARTRCFPLSDDYLEYAHLARAMTADRYGSQD